MNCIKCGQKLTSSNWRECDKKHWIYTCKHCDNKRKRLWRLHNKNLKKQIDHEYYLNNSEVIKARARKREAGLGFIKLVENDWNEPVDWHHVDDDHVVPIPRYLHKMCYTGDREKHRELCNKLIKILYGDIL